MTLPEPNPSSTWTVLPVLVASTTANSNLPVSFSTGAAYYGIVGKRNITLTLNPNPNPGRDLQEQSNPKSNTDRGFRV